MHRAVVGLPPRFLVLASGVAVKGSELFPDIEEALDRLRLQWEGADGFWFGVVAGNHRTARSALRVAVEAGLCLEGKTLDVRPAASGDAEKAVDELLESMSREAGRAAVHWLLVDDVEKEGKGASFGLLGAIDDRLELFRTRGFGGLVVEGPDSVKQRLRAAAPALFAERAWVVEPRNEVSGPALEGFGEGVEQEHHEGLGVSAEELRRLALLSADLGEGRAARAARAAAKQRAVDGLLASGRTGAAAGMLDDVDELIDGLCREDPDDPWPATARFTTHLQRGRVALDRGPLARARDHFGEAIAHASAEPRSSRRLRRLRAAHDWMAGVAVDVGDIDSAVQHATTALGAARAWSDEAPEDPERLRVLTIAHNRMGEVLARAGRRRDARASLRVSLGIRKRLAASPEGPPRLRRDLSICHEKLGDLSALNGALADAERHYTRSLGLREELAEDLPSGDSAPGGARRDLAAVHGRLGSLARRAGDVSAATRGFRRAVEILRALDRAEPGHTGVRLDLVQATSILGDLARGRGDQGKALVHYDEALRLAGELATADFGSVLHLDALATSHAHLGEQLWRMEDFEEADNNLRSVRDVRLRIASIRPDDPAAAESLALAYERLERVADVFGRDDVAAANRDAGVTERARGVGLLEFATLGTQRRNG